MMPDGMAALAAGAGGESDALADRTERVGRMREEPSEAAGGEDDSAAGKEARSLRPCCEHARDATVRDEEAARLQALDDGNGGRMADRGDEGPHDGAPGAVPRGMNDAAAAMRGLETEGQPALRIAIEDDAAPLQLGDRRRGRRRDARGDRRVGESVAGGDRVGGMQCGCIVLT